MGISLYTTRLVLEALGVEDYGLYNIVGGIVLLFSIINQALSSSTSRFLTFELGGGDAEKLRKTFSASFGIHCFIALVVLLLTETVGLWYVNTRLVVPPERMTAANWVYQFSIISCMLSLTQVPYAAIIIAHERMKIYAWVGLAEGLFKLLIAFLLFHIPAKDILILYGGLICFCSILIQLYYRFYCISNFSECKLMFVKEKDYYKSMISFSLWQVIGVMGYNGSRQCIDILINRFFGVLGNAASGIAYRVESSITIFAYQFISAVNPQLVKACAAKEVKRILTLLTDFSKYSFLLLYIISLPFFIEADYILGLWLKETPEYTISFLRIILITRLGIITNVLVCHAVYALGNNKWINIFSGGICLLIIPSVYIFYKLDFPPESAFIINGIILIACNFIQLILLKKELHEFSILYFIIHVYAVACLISLLSALLPIFVFSFFKPGFLRLCMVCIASVISVGFFGFLIGVNKENRGKIISTMKNKIWHTREV
jgi:O-antigen/teichoic acid export membrane protein